MKFYAASCWRVISCDDHVNFFYKAGQVPCIVPELFYICKMKQMWQSQVEVKHYSVLTTLLHLKCCSTELPLLRAWLVHTIWTYQVFSSYAAHI